MMSKKIYLLSWEPVGFPEWDLLCDEEGKRKILDECLERGWVTPASYMIDIEDVRKLLKEKFSSDP